MIKICIPFYKEITAECRESIESLPKDTYTVTMRQGTFIAEVRNALINGRESSALWQKINGDFSHILFVDSDIQFTEKNIDLLVNRKLPIIGGAYKAKGKDGMCAGKFADDGNVIFARPETTGVHRVDWVGAGFLLVRVEAFSLLPYPWFRHEYIRSIKNGIELQAQTSEDIGFCINAQRHGLFTFCDFDCIVNHICEPEKKEAADD